MSNFSASKSSAINVQQLTTMAVSATCTKLIEINSVQQLAELTLPESPLYILGEGSNTLFIDNQTPTLLLPKLMGIEVSEDEQHFVITAGAGENWHNLVKFTVANNMPGLENLALIPGSIGAAPVQNIGAYGVELADFCHSVNWFDFQTKTLQTLTAQQCQFAYRESVFKHQLKGKGVITSVTLTLPKAWQPILNYAGLNELPSDVSAQAVMAKVIAIRSSKLPDPLKLANCGSFFKNPVVDRVLFDQLQQNYPQMPYYPQSSSSVKLAAGWLIEQAGLKGYRVGDAGVHQKQALVLVNFGQASGQDIASLAQLIINKVNEKFAIKLTPEVRIVGKHGECLITGEAYHV